LQERVEFTTSWRSANIKVCQLEDCGDSKATFPTLVRKNRRRRTITIELDEKDRPFASVHIAQSSVHS